ncbi:hypothetical protein A9X04_22405 [Mycobacterium sp. E3247]|nr:hypothetical protein A9X04_22405 [Mycobacterium sp. E3247]
MYSMGLSMAVNWHQSIRCDAMGVMASRVQAVEESAMNAAVTLIAKDTHDAFSLTKLNCRNAPTSSGLV